MHKAIENFLFGLCFGMGFAIASNVVNFIMSTFDWLLLTYVGAFSLYCLLLAADSFCTRRTDTEEFAQ
jgi:hypothetical protein